MGIKTKIPWCDSTLGLVMGCSAGCELGDRCFAERWCRRLAGRPGYPKDFSKPELFLHRLADLRRWSDLTGEKREAIKDFKGNIICPAKPHLDGLPRIVFLNDLGETFDPALPPDWLTDPWKGREWPSVLATLAWTPHIYVVLTKQAKRMHQFFDVHRCPPNVWPGVSVTDQTSADKRVPWLLRCQTNVRIISHEPATGPVDWSAFFPNPVDGFRYWLISGGMSGPGATPCDLAWLRSDRDQAKAAGVAFFCKQDSEPRSGQQGRIPDELWKIKEVPRAIQRS